MTWVSIIEAYRDVDAMMIADSVRLTEVSRV